MAVGLAGKAAIVTGAAQGVGLAIARGLARAGASVMMADADEPRLAAEVAAIAAEGLDGRATAFCGDLGQKLGMANLMASTMEAYEGVDFLVNAALLATLSDPLNPEADRLEAALAQNVARTLRLTQVVARRMAELAAAEAEGPDGPGDRAILNLTSIHARGGPPELLALSVSTAALDQMTRALALALAPRRIRVNGLASGRLALRPGGGEAEAAVLGRLAAAAPPIGRGGEAAEAAAALFLLSPAARFVTGQALDVDGGLGLLAQVDREG